jgi:hypothetical protein
VCCFLGFTASRCRFLKHTKQSLQRGIPLQFDGREAVSDIEDLAGCTVPGSNFFCGVESDRAIDVRDAKYRVEGGGRLLAFWGEGTAVAFSVGWNGRGNFGWEKARKKGRSVGANKRACS